MVPLLNYPIPLVISLFVMFIIASLVYISVTKRNYRHLMRDVEGYQNDIKHHKVLLANQKAHIKQLIDKLDEFLKQSEDLKEIIKKLKKQ